MTSPLISVLSPSSTGPMPGGAAAAGNPFQAEGPSFSSVLGNQQAQRQAANTAPAPKPVQNNSNGSGTQAPSGAPAKSQQASSQQASQGSESQAAESSASGQGAGRADQHAAADAAQGEATQAAGSQADARAEETRVAGDETANLHTLALAGAAALSASVDTRQASASSPSPQASTLESTANATPAGQLTLADQAGSRQEAATRGTAVAQANAAGRQPATETGSRTAGTAAAEATLTADIRAGTQAAANDAGIAIAAATTLAAGNTQNSQANSQATVLRRAEPLTPARAAMLEGARRAVEAAQARAAQQETGGTQGTDTAEFLDMLAYARSRSQPVAAAAGAGSSGAEAASSTPAFMPTAPAMAAATPAATPVVATPLGSPYWGGEFGRQMVNMARSLENGSQVIEMRLDPPDLGPIRISLSLSDNVAQAAFVSPHAVVRQTVENALPQLQQLLAEAGIALGDTSVSDQNQPGQQAGEGNGNGHGAAGNGGPGTGESGGAALLAGSAPARAAGNPNALVDTFA